MSDILEGTVERFTFHNEENGYTVARFLGAKGIPYTVVGNMLGVNVGESLRLTGEWFNHPQYGTQFKVETYETVLPATVEGIRRYLGSGLIRGIGPVTARRIVKRFGLGTLDIIEKDPDQLRLVLGVGHKRIEMIKKAWAEQKKIKDLMLFLQGHNVSTGLAVKIYKQYGDESLDVVRRDPYQLARDIYGIGFLTADRIAQSLGLPHDAPQRVQAGLTYVLGQMADEGHVYVPQPELADKASEILKVEGELISEAVASLEEERLVYRERLPYQVRSEAAREPERTLAEAPAVYLSPFYHGEVNVASLVRMLACSTSRMLPFFNEVLSEGDWGRLWDEGAAQDRLTLSPAQREAVQAALTHPVTVLTGGPGTGKTTTVRTILQLLACRGCRSVLAAPTGRAAKRLTELSGQEAKTIHRLLEFSPEAGSRFQRNEGNPLRADMVIVDEASMLDLLLTYHLLKAIPPGSHLLLVGDIDQLPSVGAGNVLRDIIDSQQVPVIRLQRIFRQASNSWIVENAHRINHGQMPLFAKDASDFFLFPAEEPERAADLVVDVVANRIPRRFGYDPRTEIQALCPMHRGAAGVTILNQRLQESLNPPTAHKPERRAGGITFRVGDRVMQMRNNYEKEVFNGDIGSVTRVRLEDQLVDVRIDDRLVTYDFVELDELTLAYAISVHKSQGSEYPAVVIPLLTQHYMMLQRNLLYTAVTRARELVVIIGSRRAIGIAVKNARIAERHTGLQERLRQPSAGDASPTVP